ncbi:hypothetical protein AMELA_G00129120 [Ameiurus melas]|uniref:Uncharacterized protein n=1 Tax=Ameiurus melas TaxID=219545 RepID=A0A7J6ASI3_AMEME|nr:hypothetical protein AMELA_G00129120 [Ameiurus melas]
MMIFFLPLAKTQNRLSYWVTGNLEPIPESIGAQGGVHPGQGNLNMEVRARRKHQTSKHKAEARNSSALGESVGPRRSRRSAAQQSSSTVGVRAVLRRAVTWMKRSALFSWLHHATVTLRQSIMGNQSWPVALVRIGLWLLLLWLLSNLHMGLPCFLLALVFWVYKTYGGGPPLPTSINWWQEE